MKLLLCVMIYLLLLQICCSLLNVSRHIKQHLKRKVDVRRMSFNKDLETFHYFRMHDLNKDGKIDGVELIKGLTHLHEKMNENTGSISETDLEDIVSETLKKLDIDDDGYITYAEYRQIV
ncbi:unnamed protein product [Brugia timori]|uniref:EF-hand domain-containing protein n=1 Tax=Brugia timori TaxID=42155 RepID=A0A0R3Q8B6_9BILA|nr:unnamed protein product [Brugia timori]